MIIEEYQTSAGTLSDHQKYHVPSEEMTKLKQVMLHTLSVFHRYVEEQQIYYSLSGGSLIGFYCGADMIPWDDDIDVEIREEDALHFVQLYHSGAEPEKITKYDRGFPNQHTRIIELYGEKFEIIMNTANYICGEYWLMKLRPVDHGCFHNVPGGLDIATVYTQSQDQPINSWDLRTLGINPQDMTPTGCPEVKFGGVVTRALTPELGKPYLDEKYGTKWSVKKHPSIKYRRSIFVKRIKSKLRSILPNWVILILKNLIPQH